MKKNELITLAFIEGGLVMLLETSSPLIVAPILGHSIIIWAAMICVSIGALAMGYFLGGYLSRKSRSESFVIKLFSFNALLLFVGWLMMYYQNYSESELGTPFFTWMIVAVVLFIPLVLFGSTTPLIVAQLNEKFEADKAVVGRVYSISTMGGILFSLLAGYFFIPEIGIGDTILVTLLFASAMPVLYFFRQRQLKFAIPISFLGISSLFLTQKEAELPDSSELKVQYFSESINGQLIVADFEQNEQRNRILFINRMGQTWVNMDRNYSIWPYVNYVTSAASIYPRDSRSLVLGLGGGIIPRQMAQYAGHRVDAVELDERIIDISKQYFGLKGTGVKMYADDARRFVKSATKKYDFIVMDIFNGEILPSHGLSKEAFEDVKHILSPNGLVVINFNGFINGKEGLPGRSLIKTLKAAGFSLKLFDAGIGKIPEKDRNMLYLAYLKEPEWNNATINVTLPEGEYKIGEHLIDPSTIDYSDGLVITDDKPVMEYINRYAAKSWRKDYLKNFTLKFREEYDLPLVK